MLITIIGILAAALTSLSYIPQVKKALPAGSTRRPLVQNACGARSWTGLVDRIRHPQRRSRDHRRERRQLSLGCDLIGFKIRDAG